MSSSWILLLVAFFGPYALLAAVAPSSPGLLVTVNPNTSIPINSTLSKSLSTLPSDPFTTQSPDASTTIIFSSYGAPVPEIEVLECLLEANEDVVTSIEAAGHDDFIGRAGLIYTSSPVSIIVFPSSAMRWSNLGETLLGLRTFMARYEYVKMVFQMQDGARALGYGFVTVVG